MKRIPFNHLALMAVSALLSVGCAAVFAPRDGTVVDLARMEGWKIVAPAEATPSERYAAEEFQRFFAEASGVRLPIVTTLVQRAFGRILIGQAAAAMALGRVRNWLIRRG